MAPNTRSGRKPDVAQNPYDIPESSPIGVATRSSRTTASDKTVRNEPPKLRMSNRRTGVKLSQRPEPKAVATGKRKRDLPESPQAGSSSQEKNGGEEYNGERNSPAPTPAFIRDINEGIRGSPTTSEARPALRPNHQKRNDRPQISDSAPVRTVSIAEVEVPQPSAAAEQLPVRRGRGRPKRKDHTAEHQPNIVPEPSAPEAQEAQGKRPAPEAADQEEHEEELNAPLPVPTAAAVAETKHTLIQITAGGLAHLETTISLPAWTGRQKECHLLLKGQQETEEEWLDRLRDDMTGRSRSMAKPIGQLLAIIRAAPRDPNYVDDQSTYLSERFDAMDALMIRVQRKTDQLSSAMESRSSEARRHKSEAAMNDTRSIYIPLLVFVVLHTFHLGGGSGQNDQIHPSTQGTFTKITLSLASRLIQSVMTLWEALKAAYVSAADETKHLQGLYDQLSEFERNVTWGLKVVAERDPERLRRAKERDEAAERAKNARRQEEVNERDKRLSAFIASTQRMRQELVASKASEHHRTILSSDAESESDMDESFELVSEGGLSRDSDAEEEELARAQLEQERNAELARQEERQRQETERRKKQWYMEKDREAQERRAAASKARREDWERRFAAFAASTQQMKTD